MAQNQRNQGNSRLHRRGLDPDRVEPKKRRDLTEAEKELFLPVVQRYMQASQELQRISEELDRLCKAIEPAYVPDRLAFVPTKLAFFEQGIFTVKNPA